MFRALIEWWSGLSPWLRGGIAVAFLLLSTVFLLFDRIWIWGWVVGGVLLVFSFPSSNEKKGYHDL